MDEDSIPLLRLCVAATAKQGRGAGGAKEKKVHNISSSGQFEC